MLGEKHDLIHEFPEYKDKIHELKTTNQHFARLFEEYHDLEHEVRRIEEGVETPSDDYLEERKKIKLSLKDQLFEMLSNERYRMAFASPALIEFFADNRLREALASNANFGDALRTNALNAMRENVRER